MDLLFIVKIKGCVSLFWLRTLTFCCLLFQNAFQFFHKARWHSECVHLCVCAVYDKAWHKDGVVTGWTGGGGGGGFNESSQMWALFSSLQGKCVRLLRSSIIWVWVDGWVYVSVRAGGLHCQANILESHVHYKDKYAYGITVVMAYFAFVEILLCFCWISRRKRIKHANTKGFMSRDRQHATLCWPIATIF